MARKLRFFKEQMLKADVSPVHSTTKVDVNIDDLEVRDMFVRKLFSSLFYFIT